MGKTEVFFLTVVAYFICGAATAEILLEEGGHQVLSSNTKLYDRASVISPSGQFGVGVYGAGVSGIFGAGFEFGLPSGFSLAPGIGVGNGFQSFHIKLKRNIQRGRWISKYWSAGYARWFSSHLPASSRGAIGIISQGGQASRNGQTKFSKNILFPGLGIQYLQAEGNWQGASAYLEVQLLSDLGELIFIPTGEMGLIYYF